MIQPEYIKAYFKQFMKLRRHIDTASSRSLNSRVEIMALLAAALGLGCAHGRGAAYERSRALDTSGQVESGNTVVPFVNLVLDHDHAEALRWFIMVAWNRNGLAMDSSMPHLRAEGCNPRADMSRPDLITPLRDLCVQLGIYDQDQNTLPVGSAGSGPLPLLGLGPQAVVSTNAHFADENGSFSARRFSTESGHQLYRLLAAFIASDRRFHTTAPLGEYVPATPDSLASLACHADDVREMSLSGERRFACGLRSSVFWRYDVVTSYVGQSDQSRLRFVDIMLNLSKALAATGTVQRTHELNRLDYAGLQALISFLLDIQFPNRDMAAYQHEVLERLIEARDEIARQLVRARMRQQNLSNSSRPVTARPSVEMPIHRALTVDPRGTIDLRDALDRVGSDLSIARLRDLLRLYVAGVSASTEDTSVVVPPIHFGRDNPGPNPTTGFYSHGTTTRSNMLLLLLQLNQLLAESESRGR